MRTASQPAAAWFAEPVLGPAKPDPSAVSTSIGMVVGKLDDVFVAADYRGKGVGTRMLKALKAELKKKGVARIDAAVHKRSPDAARYYKRLGFKALGRETGGGVVGRGY
jgi:GNAT superfamily N-acetyltransferase